MTVLPDAVRAYEQELLQKADMLAMGLRGPQIGLPRARRRGSRRDFLAPRPRRGRPSPASRWRSAARDPRRAAPVVVAARGGGADDIEDFILDILAENPLGLSVQDIVDNLDEAQLEIKRKTLVVRLHRMVQAGRLSSQAHGHYTLSEAERSRRRA